MINLISICGQPYLKINSKEFNLCAISSMYLALEELRLLNTGVEINFENFAQLRKLIDKINNLKIINLVTIND